MDYFHMIFYYIFCIIFTLGKAFIKALPLSFYNFAMK